MAQKSTKKGTTKKTTTKKVVKKTTPKKVVKKTPPKKEEVKKTIPKKEEVVKEPVVEIKEEVKVEKKNIFTKRNIIIIVIALVIINIIVGTILIYNNPKNKLTRSIKYMGKDFYTNYFYNTLKEGRSNKELSEILERYKDTGIKINLKNLSQFDSSKYKEEIDNMVENNKCIDTKTRAVIYPKAPYGKDNYKIKIELNCNF